MSSNYISILAYINEKYRALLLDKQFVLTDFFTEDILEMGSLLNQYISESNNIDFDLEDFFQGYSDNLLDELTEILGELSLNEELTSEELESLNLILDSIAVDYSERERIEDNKGDEKDEV